MFESESIAKITRVPVMHTWMGQSLSMLLAGCASSKPQLNLFRVGRGSSTPHGTPVRTIRSAASCVVSRGVWTYPSLGHHYCHSWSLLPASLAKGTRPKHRDCCCCCCVLLTCGLLSTFSPCFVEVSAESRTQTVIRTVTIVSSPARTLIG